MVSITGWWPELTVGNPTLSGSGTLTATVTTPFVFTTAPFSGAGVLSAPLKAGTAPALSGAGTLSATVGVTKDSIPAALSGSGTLTATLTPGYSITAALSGTGVLAGATGESITPALSGAGTLAGAVGGGVAAALSGAGTLSGTAAGRYAVAAALSGAGTLTATLKVGISAALSGVGTLTATAAGRYALAPALSGVGTLSASVYGNVTNALPIWDPFTGTNGADISAGWTQRTTPKFLIQSNAACPNTTSSWTCEDLTYPALTNDMRATAIVGPSPAGGEYYLVGIRCSNSRQMWAVCTPGAQWAIQSNANTFANPTTTLTNRANTVGNVALAAADVLEIEAKGQVYVLKKNGVPTVVWLDSTSAYAFGAGQRQAAMAAYVGSTTRGFADFYFDDLPVDTFYPSQMTKSGTQTWATSSTWVGVTSWTATMSANYASLLSGDGLVSLNTIDNATITASVPYTGSTGVRAHTIRVQKNGVTIATGTAVTTTSGTATCTLIGVSLAVGDVVTVQMNSDGAAAGTITDATPALTIQESVLLAFSVGDEIYDTGAWPDADVDKYFDTLVNESAWTARIPMQWDRIQPTRTGAWDWARADKLYASAIRAGVKINALMYANRGAVVGGSTWFGGTDTAAEFAAFCSAVASRYPLIKEYEIWNESNHITFWVRTVSKSDYTSYVVAAAGAIRAAVPDCIIITGASMCLPYPAAGNTPHEFVQGFYDNGARAAFDRVANHPYPSELTGADNWAEQDACWTALKANGDPSKMVVDTEFGEPIGGTGSYTYAHVQTAYSDAAYQVSLRTLQATQRLTIYELKDSLYYVSTDDQAKYGLYYSGADGTHAAWVRKNWALPSPTVPLLAGTGTLSALAVFGTYTAAPALNGAGTLTATLGVTKDSLAVPLSGAGTLTATVGVTKDSIPAALSGVGTLSVTIGGTPISYSSSAAAAATTVTIGTHAIGDLLVIVAYNTSNVIPTLPAGWTTPTGGTSQSNGIGSRIGYKVATATNDASGTWTNAGLLQVHVYPGATAIGACATSSSATATVSYAALTLKVLGDSWMMLAGLQGSATNYGIQPVTGFTYRQAATGNSVTMDTNGTVGSNYAGASITTNSATANLTWSMEILN